MTHHEREAIKIAARTLQGNLSFVWSTLQSLIDELPELQKAEVNRQLGNGVEHLATILSIARREI